MGGFLEMTDEDFAKLAGPPSEEVPVEEPEEDVVEEPVEEEEEESVEEKEEVGDEAPEEKEEEVIEEPQEEEKGEPLPEEEDSTKVENSEEMSYKSFYEKVMAPFKANGKLIELKSPEEAIQLMQMGANFTRKMQDIAPHRKVLLMLENNGLLDETKLSYLIDLEKKNPEAIKRLVKESGIDPLDIDPEKEPAYTVGNHHAVSDQEANFRAVLDELVSTPTGQETARVISEWDQASKNKLFYEPAAMVAINQQRENGIYDRIATEIERQKALGNLPVSTPFLDAYTQIGNMMQQAGVLGGTPQPQTPIATKVAAPKARVDNSEKAKAAAPSKSTSKKATPLINPLAMSDEDFLKQMANRL